jgi:TRAP-type C4-dicarboxylate transport system substrate-binding protein
VTARLVPLLLLLGASAGAEPVTLRMSTPAPEGTGWARELHSYARDVEQATHGAVKVKWYMGSVTGDELETLDRVNKGQLDGVGSGGMACQRVVPSLAVTRLLGVFQSREEAAHVSRALRQLFDEEARQKGFELLAVNGMGADAVFTRQPVRNLDELRKLKLWRWNLDETGSKMAKLLGLQPVSLPLEAGGSAYDRGEVQGFMSVPAAALAFQWSARARYVLDLKTGFLEGCVFVAARAFDRLAPEHKEALRVASTKLGIRWEQLGKEQDELLLGGVLAKQGVTVMRASESFRAQFFAEAGAARERMVQEGAIPRHLVDRVMQILADYRAEHVER